MDLIIFNPPRYRHGQNHKFNNALLWLASYVRQRGVKVRIVPLNNEKHEETVRTEIARYRPEFAAVSCKWWDTLYSSSYIASLIKKCDQRIVTIAGGHTATFFAKELVKHTDFDVVIRGDGEEPLYRLVTRQEPVNSVFKGDSQLRSVHGQYVQTEDSLKDICLVEDLEDVVSDINVVNSYVWTGKGCRETCFYCSGNVRNTAESFGRAAVIYRPIDVVVHDVEILAKYPGITRITLDFYPLRGNLQETYHLELFAALERKKYNCYFCAWSLPSKKLIDALARTFNFVELCLDVQTLSDRLRKLLGERRSLKPYFSDGMLEDVLSHCHRYDNFTVDMSTLMGLPFEQDQDIQSTRTVSDHFYDKYEALRYPYVSPVNVEPGSLLMRNPKLYDMVLFRKDFADFMRYTKRSFENNINCYQPGSYGDGVFHPLGACPREDYEGGDIFRVYESWKRVKANIDVRSREKMMVRVRKYKKYGLMRAGILGGIDHPALSGWDVE